MLENNLSMCLYVHACACAHVQAGLNISVTNACSVPCDIKFLSSHNTAAGMDDC